MSTNQRNIQMKLAEDLQEGDLIEIENEDTNYKPEVWQIEVVDIDTDEGIVWVDFDKGQDTFATGYMVKTLTA